MNNDELALERTKLANQRTLLAYSRTAMMVFATGITFLKLLAEDEVLRITGFVLIPLSVLVLVYGIVSFTRFNRRMQK
ncbi:MAG: DUF202 domain-containing protein [Cyclobacteriaceae bacterium]